MMCFSDFDSRPFEERALSDDFISEARKMAKEKPEGKIELKMLMPTDKRNHDTETIIIKNLHSHFRHFAHLIETEIKHARCNGFILVASGFLPMVAAAYIISISERKFYFNILRIVLEPTEWFMVWAGFDNILYGLRKKNRIRYTFTMCLKFKLAKILAL